MKVEDVFMWEMNSFTLNPFLCCSKRIWSLSTLQKGKLRYADSGHGTTMDKCDQKIGGGSRGFAGEWANRKSWRSSGQSGDPLQTGNVGKEGKECCQDIPWSGGSCLLFPSIAAWTQSRAGWCTWTADTTKGHTEVHWTPSRTWDQEKTTERLRFGGPRSPSQ